MLPNEVRHHRITYIICPETLLAQHPDGAFAVKQHRC